MWVLTVNIWELFEKVGQISERIQSVLLGGLHDTVDDTNQYLTTSGDLLNLPSGGSYAAYKDQNPKNWGGTHGPAYRVVSTTGFRAVSGDFTLYNPYVDTHLNPKFQESPEVHLGSHILELKNGKAVKANEIDAGLTYGPRGWGMFWNGNGKMLINKSGDLDHKGYNRPINVGGRYIPKNGVTPIVNMTYYAYGLKGDKNTLQEYPVKAGVISSFDAVSLDNVIAIGGPTDITKSTLPYLVLKRVHAIAQVKATSASVSNIRKSNSRAQWMWGEFSNFTLGNTAKGSLMDSNGNWVLWSLFNTYSKANVPDAIFEPTLLPGSYTGYPDTGQAFASGNTSIPYTPYWSDYVTIICLP